MERSLMNSLIEWKTSRNRKPLILRGARQTGKTWLLTEFARQQFSSFVYVDLLDNARARALFEDDFDIDRILRGLSLETGVSINENTLVFLDEIQESPRALTSLKYFYQKRPEQPVVAAGSYLGIAKHEDSSFPVGKVDSLTLHPLTFLEFLQAIGQEQFADAILHSPESIDRVFYDRLADFLKTYLFVGGMPEPVADFVLHQDFVEVRRLQKNILAGYDADFSKHAPARILERMRLVWNSLPLQLAKENRKFVFSAVRPGARARDFEECIQWLVDYGVITKVNRVSAIRTPVKSYAEDSIFKLFCVDVGLLGALAETDVDIILNGSQIYTEFKGALTEQYVCQQLVAYGYTPYYWSSDRSDAEVDFVIQKHGQPIPIEVKSAENLKSKSLAAARKKFGLDTSIRFSLSGYREDPGLTNIPLWGIAG